MSFIHTCYRITDPERSVAFYEALGFEKRRELPIRDEAVNYFLGIPGEDGPELELTYNFETPDGGYDVGTGYGHIALTVGDLDATLDALKQQGIEPERPPYTVREGGSRICFLRDPDGNRSVANSGDFQRHPTTRRNLGANACPRRVSEGGGGDRRSALLVLRPEAIGVREPSERCVPQVLSEPLRGPEGVWRRRSRGRTWRARRGRDSRAS
jgi:lactoylglutathione lyase